jgi:hypothetical protein
MIIVVDKWIEYLVAGLTVMRVSSRDLRIQTVVQFAANSNEDVGYRDWEHWPPSITFRLWCIRLADFKPPVSGLFTRKRTNVNSLEAN